MNAFSVYGAILSRHEYPYLQLIPYSLLSDGDEKISYQFIKAYKERFAVYPSWERFQQEYPDAKLARVDEHSPIEDIVDNFLRKRRSSKGSTFLEDIAAKVRDGETIRLDDLHKAYKVINAGLDKVVSSKAIELDDMLFARGTFKTGIHFIDENIKGIAPGELFCIVARPNVGKTIFSIWLTYKWLMMGKRVMFISCEMTKQEILQRFVSLHGNYNPNIWREYYDLDAEKQDEIKDTLAKFIAECPGELIFPDEPNLTPQGVHSIIQRYNPDAVVIDSYHRMRSGNSDEKDDYSNAKNLTLELATISIVTLVPIFLSTHLNRTASTSGKPVGLEMIARSDEIAMTSSFVMTLDVDPSIDEDLYLAKLIKSRSKGKNAELKFRRNPTILTFEETYE